MLKTIVRQQSSGGTHAVALYLGLLLAAILAVALLTLSLVVVVLDIDVDTAGHAKVYWTDQAGQFSEIQSKSVALQSGHNAQVLMLWSWSDVTQVRLTPIDRPARATINHIVLTTLGYPPVIYNEAAQFQLFRAIKDINIWQVDAEHLLVNTGSNTAQIEWDVKHDKTDATAIFLANALNIPSILLLLAICLFVGFFFPAAHIYALFLGLFFLLLANTQEQLPGALLSIEMQTSAKSELTVYWSNITRVYTEDNVKRIKTEAGNAVYKIDIGKLQKINSLRIDPSKLQDKVSISNIKITQPGYFPINIRAENNYYAVDFKKQPSLNIAGEYLVLDAQKAGEFFEILINNRAFKIEYTLIIYYCSLCILLLLTVCYYVSRCYYPQYFPRAKIAGKYVSCLILIGMLGLYMLGPQYAIYSKLHDLLLSTSGTQAHYDLADFPYRSTEKILAKMSLLNVAYSILLLSSIAAIRYFYSWIQTAIFSLILGLMLLIFGYINSNATLLDIEMQVEKPDFVNVYWADEGENYLQQRSVSALTDSNMQHYQLAIENLNNIHNIRIEPFSKAGKVALQEIKITEPGYAPIILNAANHFFAVDLVTKNKLTNTATTQKLTIENNQLIFSSDNNTEYFEIIIDPKAFKTGYSLTFYAQALSLLLGLFVSIYYGSLKWSQYQANVNIITARTALAFIALMVLQMAWFSEYDHHPDEKAHIDSVDYYTQYSDFPVVGDGRSMSTYQYPWGISRLDDLGVSYFIMGKFKNLITTYLEDTVFTCRLFNGVLVIALLFATRNSRFALFMVPFLCSPQFWYLFSYTNRDAFALFLSILLAWQLANSKSALQQYLAQPGWLVHWRHMLLAGILLGILSIELSNYIIFILFFVAVLLWQGLFEANERKQFFQKCLLLLLLAGSIYGVRKAVDVHINGFNKQEQKTALAEFIAGPEFKPSIAGTNAGFFGLRLKQKGVSALDLFKPQWDWHHLTFKSFTGTYGHEFAEYSPAWYYDLLQWLYLMVMASLLYAVARYGVLQHWLLTALAAIFIFGDLLMGFLYSWLYDFQPQGRYVFPLIPIFMLWFWRIAPLQSRKVNAFVRACVLFLVALGFFSFRSIALTYMVALF